MSDQTSNDAPKLYYLDIDELRPLGDDNPNAGTERGQYMLEKSFEEYAPWRSIAITDDDRIAAGNHAAQIYGEQGGKRVLVVETSGDELVAVKRRDVDSDDPRALGYAIMDNRTTEVNLKWNPAVIADVKRRGDVDLNWMFFEDELDAINYEPPTLDDLENQYGEHDETRVYPEIRAKVPPDIYAKYLELTRKYGDDDMARLIGLINGISV